MCSLCPSSGRLTTGCVHRSRGEVGCLESSRHSATHPAPVGPNLPRPELSSKHNSCDRRVEFACG
eukprot:7400720-Alexandrium_andersonii.AAC.1